VSRGWEEGVRHLGEEKTLHMDAQLCRIEVSTDSQTHIHTDNTQMPCTTVNARELSQRRLHFATLCLARQIEMPLKEQVSQF